MVLRCVLCAVEPVLHVPMSDAAAHQRSEQTELTLASIRMEKWSPEG